MTRREPFNSIYSQGFLRAAVCAPKVALASPERNLEETLKLAEQASLQEAALAVFSELGEVFWSHYTDAPNTPLYPFGFGLSYTTFTYSALRLDRTEIGCDNSLLPGVRGNELERREGGRFQFALRAYSKRCCWVAV